MNTKRRIDLGRYEKPVEEKVGGGVISGDLQEVMSTSMELKEVMRLVAPNKIVFWVSAGDWSMYQLLMALLEITGPATVHISSYAVSETTARYLIQLKEARIIQKLYMVIDSRVDTRTAGSLQIIKSICDDYSLVDTHAKVTVITNDKWRLAVIGSANYTENKRYEAGSIACSDEAVNQQLTWINKALKDGSKQ